MGDSLLACLMMICSNGPSLHEKKEVEKFLLAVVARFKAFKRRVPSRGCGVKPPQRASASKAKSSVLSQLSGLENVEGGEEARVLACVSGSAPGHLRRLG
jgi:hypothetical protein